MKLKMLTIAAGAIAIGFVTGWAQALPLTVSAEGVKKRRRCLRSDQAG